MKRTVKFSPVCGLDVSLMKACIIEAALMRQPGSPSQHAEIAVQMYLRMVDIVAAAGGEMEVPHVDQH